jgi:protein-S-isoprenylcysteine O-methyltransferase Ste14
MNRQLFARVVWQFLLFPIVMGAVLFLPAGTFDYWQAWVFVGVFFACTVAITAWMAVADPALLERRMSAGPAAEKETTQKIIMAFAFVSFAGLAVVPALDRRFGWSEVPTWVVILGDVLIALSYVGFYFVFRENTYGAATIQVAEGQRVISTGPYAAVRHPMYAGALVLMLGMPLALGSWWGLLIIVPSVLVLVWRILDEERFLAENLPGYTDYEKRVRYRMVPFVW